MPGGRLARLAVYPLRSVEINSPGTYRFLLLCAETARTTDGTTWLADGAVPGCGSLLAVVVLLDTFDLRFALHPHPRAAYRLERLV